MSQANLLNTLEPARAFRLGGFNGVAAGGTATIDIPVVGTYKSLWLVYDTSTAGGPSQANMSTHITEVRLLLNGTVQRRTSAADIFMLNNYYAEKRLVNTFVAGYLPIHFVEEWRKTAAVALSLAWGMGGVTSFQIEVDIAPGASSPTLNLAVERYEATMNIGAIKKIQRHSVTAGATGLLEVTDLPKRDSYYAIHMNSAAIGDVSVGLDQEQLIKNPIGDLKVISHWSSFEWQDNWTHLSWDQSGQVSDMLKMFLPRNGQMVPVSDFRIGLDMTAAETFSILTETVGLPT